LKKGFQNPSDFDNRRFLKKGAAVKNRRLFKILRILKAIQKSQIFVSSKKNQRFFLKESAVQSPKEIEERRILNKSDVKKCSAIGDVKST
jgi:hypothetical protein